MEIKDFINTECMKYWQPPKGNNFVSLILANPEKYQEYLFTPKMDGEWNKLIWDGEYMYMLSRTLNVKGEYTDRAAKVPHIVDEFAATLPKDTVLLGELAFPDVSKSSKDVGSIMRSLVPKALEKQKEEKNKLHFYVFDCLMWAGEDISQHPYEQRFVNNAALKQYYTFDTHYSNLLTPQPIEALPDFLTEYFAHGGEGVVLVDKNQPYHFGKRPVRSSVKIKKQLADFEAKVIGVLEPSREYEGTEIETWPYWMERVDLMNGGPYGWSALIGNYYNESLIAHHSYIPVTKPYFYGWKIGIRCEYEGREFSVTSGLTDEDREWLSTADAMDSIQSGSLYAVCSAMELTPDSVRHPYLVRMRDDVK
jgi:hypothetical protein